jgi:hypothetical protein
VKTNSKNHSNNWRRNTLLHHQWVMEEIREEIKRFKEVKENENTTSRT